MILFNTHTFSILAKSREKKDFVCFYTDKQKIDRDGANFSS